MNGSFSTCRSSGLLTTKELTFNLKPFSFKHTGLFPEQAANWDWFGDKIRRSGRPVKVLNLFAYTGGATLAAAKAGASVTHVDASKGMVTWAKENAHSSGLSDAPIRWIVDDCVKIRRTRSAVEIITMPLSWIHHLMAAGQKGRSGRSKMRSIH